MRDFQGQVQHLAVSKLKPSKDNVRNHPKSQVTFLAELIDEFGFDQPIVVDSEMEIIKGHGRLLAAKKLKMKTVPCLVRDDMSKEFARLSRLVDNDTVEDAWDADTLALEAGSLQKLEGDYSNEITDRLSGLMDTIVDPLEALEGGPVAISTRLAHHCPHCEYRWD